MNYDSIRDGIFGDRTGYFHREIKEASYEYQKRVNECTEALVGPNSYEIDEDTSVDIVEI